MAVFTGETVEKAIDRGLARLGVSREKVHIQIEQHEKKGFLGFGVKRARVNIEVIDEETQLKADRLAIRGTDRTTLDGDYIKSAKEVSVELNQVANAVRQAEKESDRPLTDEEKDDIMFEARQALEENRQETVAEVVADAVQEAKAVLAEEINEEIDEEINSENLEQEVERFPLNEDDFETQEEQEEVTESSTDDDLIIQEISQYLENLTATMGIPAQVSDYYDKESDSIIFELSSSQDGLLIGKHGKILQSLQTIVQAYASILTDTYIKVKVDVAGYLEKRQAFLKSLARNAIDKAKKGQTAYINDLQSYERKMIHSIVAKEAGVSSHSEGQDSRRYIVIRKTY